MDFELESTCASTEEVAVSHEVLPAVSHEVLPVVSHEVLPAVYTVTVETKRR